MWIEWHLDLLNHFNYTDIVTTCALAYIQASMKRKGKLLIYQYNGKYKENNVFTVGKSTLDKKNKHCWKLQEKWRQNNLKKNNILGFIKSIIKSQLSLNNGLFVLLLFVFFNFFILSFHEFNPDKIQMI